MGASALLGRARISCLGRVARFDLSSLVFRHSLEFLCICLCRPSVASKIAETCILCSSPYPCLNQPRCICSPGALSWRLTIHSSRTCFVTAKAWHKRACHAFASTTQVGLILALGGTTARRQWFLASVLSAAFAEPRFAVGSRSRCSSDTARGARVDSCVPSVASVGLGLAESERVGRRFGSCVAASAQGARTCSRSSGQIFAVLASNPRRWHRAP